MADRKVGLTIRAATLADTCERTLVAAARAAGVGTRQQVRAAARCFVRRHRRDADYLRWVLRSVGASSAFAVALLGLSPAPAGAEMAPFVSGFNPLSGQDVGDLSAPALGDLDGDGDADLISGKIDGTFAYSENTGSATSPAMILRTGAANPLAAQDVGFHSSPTLGDLDGDGDLDLSAGPYLGVIAYYENTGSATSPAFVPRTGAANPFNFLSPFLTYVAPSLGDLDGDGDLDLVRGDRYGAFHYYENTGSATSPAFVARTGAANPLNGQDVGDNATPSFGDLDGDGDLDLVAGATSGLFFVLENTGSATSPGFVARTGSANPLNGQDVGTESTPALGDLDGDGDPDLVAGEIAGAFSYRENLGGELPLTSFLDGLDLGAGSRSTPSLGDLDGDDDLDLVSGEGSGAFFYFENTGSATSAAFVLRTGAANPLAGQDVGAISAPSLGDLDGDGDLDLVSGESASGQEFTPLNYFENTGSVTSPAFVQRTGTANPFPFNVTFADADLAPALGDLDGDGDLDLLVGTNTIGGSDPSSTYFENTGSATSPAFSVTFSPFDASTLDYKWIALGDRDGDGDLDVATSDSVVDYVENTGSVANPAFLARFGGTAFLDSSPSFGDLDGDGDLDLVEGDSAGNFIYSESFVVQSPPPALELTGAANPLAGRDVGSLSAPALADLDADGDPDLVAGEDFGTFLFFENTRSATSPAFVPRTGAANPLNARGVGDAAKPAFGDLDGDGDFDLLSGRLAGDFTYFANTGDAVTPLFAAGLANPFGLANVGSSGSAPAFGDVDADGDLDLVVGTSYGTLSFFENTGTRTSPFFVERTGPANPFYTLDFVNDSTATLADFDADGDLDLIAGVTGGRLFYVKNQGTAASPAFAEATSPVNPLVGEDVGSNSAPAAADLDGDGDPDLVTGTLAGTFAVHYFPEPARGLLLGAGVALLKWLHRVRRRRDPH